MLRYLKPYKIFTLALLAVLFATVITLPAKADTNATFSLSPSEATININQTFSVAISVDTAGQDVECVEADLRYDTSVLQYVSTDVSKSAFNKQIPPAESGGSGSTNLTRCNLGVLNGNLLVASVNFKVLTDDTETFINFVDSTYVTSAGHYLPLIMTGSDITIPPPLPIKGPDPPGATSKTPKTKLVVSVQSNGSTNNSAATKANTPVAQPTAASGSGAINKLSNKESRFQSLVNFFKKHKSVIIIAASTALAVLVLLFIVFTRMHNQYHETNHFPNLTDSKSPKNSTSGKSNNQNMASGNSGVIVKPNTNINKAEIQQLDKTKIKKY